MTEQDRLPRHVDPAADAWLADLSQPRRALFLDRDGVINADHGYVHTAARTEWLPGIFELVADARAAGFLPIVVTNQAGIARGYYDEREFLDYTAWLHDQFSRQGAPLLATYFCPHHPEGRHGPYRQACTCRKPEPGMFIQAIADFGLDPGNSIVLGDKPSDLEAARAAGVETCRLVDADGLPAWRALVG